MVQFEKKLQENIIEKWRKHYLDYARLKKVLSDSGSPQFASSGKPIRKTLSDTGLSGRISSMLPFAKRNKSFVDFKRMSSDAVFEPTGEEDPMFDLDEENRPCTPFEEALFEEIVKFCDFYQRKIRRCIDEFQKYESSFETFRAKSIHEKLPLPTILESHHDDDDEVEEEKSEDIIISELEQHREERVRKRKKQKEAASEDDPPADVFDRKGTADSQKRALHTLYADMAFLQTFASLNYTAVIKITKKAAKTAKKWHDKQKGEELDTKLLDAENGGPVGPCRINVAHVATVWMNLYEFEGEKEVMNIIQEVEKLYAELFCESNILLAHGELQSHVTTAEAPVSWRLFHIGYRLGMCAMLGIWLLWDGILQGLANDEPSLDRMPAFSAFCALGGLVLVHWSWGLQVCAWTRARINYIYLFDLESGNTRSYIAIFYDCTTDTIVYLVLLLIYFKAELKHLPVMALCARPGIYLLVGIFYAIMRLIFPWKLRRGLWIALMNLLWPYCSQVTFFETYVGDVLTSLVKVFMNLAYAGGFIFSGQVFEKSYSSFEDQADCDDESFSKCQSDVKDEMSHLTSWQRSWSYTAIIIPLVLFLPLFFRFEQCLLRYTHTSKRWPHLFNAVKYALAQCVTLFGALHPLYTTMQATFAFQFFWVVLFLVSTLYSSWWDIHMDWGLFQNGKMLNDVHMYSRKWYFECAVVGDVFLRFLWVASLIPPSNGKMTPFDEFVNLLAPLAMLLEVCRRTVWGLFRLENEHLRNAEGNRRVESVPLHFSREREELVEPSSSVMWEIGVIVIGLGVLIAIVMLLA